MIPQLDGTFNVSDNSDTDLHSYLDLAGTSIIPYRTRSATEMERQLREKEAKRLVLEKAKRIRLQKDMKYKEAKRIATEKAQIEALIEKHRPRTPKHLMR